jgi:hypothetical protein
MLLLFVGLTAVSAVTIKLQCVDAAREAARAAARGEQGSGAGERSAPGGAEVEITIAGDTVTATVRAPVRPLGPYLPSLSVHAAAVAAVEPGVPEPAR